MGMLWNDDIESWNPKAKRLRGSLPPPPPEYDTEFISAAETLMLLASSGDGFAKEEILPTATNPSPATTSSAVVITPKKQENQFSPDSGYMCNVCGKILKSHQALGGHKTSHRVKVSITTAADDYNTTRIAIATPNSSGKKHKCSKCDDVFSSGQALGGHMRKHWDRDPTSNAAGDVSEVSSDCLAFGHNFDLNLCPDQNFTFMTNTNRKVQL